MTDTILRGGNIVFPGKGVTAGDIAIANGKITAVSRGRLEREAGEVVDLAGKYVFPGVIETHSHLGLAGGDEDIRTETDAAALGGVTTVLFFLRQPLPYEALYEHVVSVASRASRIDYSFHIVALTENHLASIPRYVEEMGVTSFKFYLTYRGTEAKTGLYGGAVLPCGTLDDGFLLEGFRQVAKYPRALALAHAENIEIINRARAELMGKGLDDMEAYALSRPDVAEAEGVGRALCLGRAAGCRVNILHLTSRAALEAFRRNSGPKDGFHIEVCHPYLALGAEDAVSTLFKVRPPLRPKADREALWEAVFSGEVGSVGSDHVPRRLAEKEGSVWRPAAGLPGTQYLFLNMLDQAHFQRGMPLETLAELLSLRPAKLYGLDDKGDIAPGKDADLLVADFGGSTALDAEAFPSYSDYSPYQGREVAAKVAMTFVRGRCVARDGRLTEHTGGAFLFRKGTEKGSETR